MDEINWNDVSDGQFASLERAVLSASTSHRCRALHELHDKLKTDQLTLSDYTPIFLLLFRTYPVFVDRLSRRAVHVCLRDFIRKTISTPQTEKAIRALVSDAINVKLAASTAFALLEWCVVFLEELAATIDNGGHDLVIHVMVAHAHLLETVMRHSIKQSIVRSAITVTRRALRAVFGNKEHGPDLVRLAVADLSKRQQEVAPYIGVIAGVSARIPQAKPVMEEEKTKVFQFYARELINAKRHVPGYIAMGISDIFISFATAEDLEKEIWPPLEKAMLRNPEVVVTGLFYSLPSCMPEHIDLSQPFALRFCKPLLACVKSSNPDLRSGCVPAFKQWADRSADEKFLTKVVDETIAPLKGGKLTAVEHRSLHGRCLLWMPCYLEVSKAIVTGMPAVISRESNDASLDFHVKAFCKHLSFLIHSNVAIAKEQLAAIVKGCEDKRVPFRKCWLINFGDMLWNADKSALTASPNLAKDCLVPVIKKLQTDFKEIAANPLPALQSGFLPIAFILTALSCQAFREVTAEDGTPLLASDDIVRQALVLSPKPSFLLNPKAYTKLVVSDELRWFNKTLSRVCREQQFESADPATKNAWAQAFMFVICGAPNPDVRREATRELRACYLNRPALVGTAIVEGMWHWLYAIDNGDRESAAVAAEGVEGKLSTVISAITIDKASAHQIEAGVLKAQLVQYLTLCRRDLIHGVNWINLVLKTGIDPGELVRENIDECMKLILLSTEDEIRSKIKNAELAACKAAADLAFVAPECSVSHIVAQIERDLDAKRIKDFGPDDLAIARTPEGVTYVDVLSTKTRESTPKSGKDRDALKWEEELRAELAKKRGQQQRKLTAEEQVKVNAQLAKEAEIRNKVQATEDIIKRGAGIVQWLAIGPPIESEGWINPAIGALYALAQLNVGELVGDAVSKAFVACSDRISSRLGDMRPFIGIATLRALGKTYLPSNTEEEALGGLITRILYRLRLSCESRPYDMVSVAYILPLIFLILEKGGIQEAESNLGEQVLLGLEILSCHPELFSDDRLPRLQVLKALLASMQKYTQHYKVIRDTLQDYCRCISSNIHQDELEVLLKGAIVPEISVRTAVLQAILAEIDLTDFDFSEHIWLACHDHFADNAEIADSIWEENALEVDENSANLIVPYLESKDEQLRGAAARALAHACEFSAEVFTDISHTLEAKYRDEIKPKPPKKDAYGMPMKVEVTDNWESRSGIALSFTAMAEGFHSDTLVEFLRFLITEGPLVDKNARVRRQMAESGTAVISLRGQERVEELMQLFEMTLETSDKATEQSDWLNEAVIVLYGSLARHLKAGDKRLQTVIRKLLEALATPSETVQYAVAGCLAPLIRLSSSEAGTYISEMMDQLLTSKKYASRRGAAYGLAGIVNGKGIAALREFRIMAHLSDAIDNKKDPNARQGAVLAFELFSQILGRTFEPYIIQIVPQLLASFGDPLIDVREACLDAAKACFANLSSFGVQQIMPTLLEGLDEHQWRSKKGACDLLGAMAYLDPQQLAVSLPDIIPPLTEVLNDSHKEVRSAANRSLQRFGDVISNPEVKSLVGILLKALSDPTKYTDDALDGLIKVSFVHYLDAPSLALVVRILERGLSDRSQTKRKASQIIGSLAHLTERKDLTAHLPILVAGLKLAVVDPVPTTRATASKALGSLIEKLGEETLPDLIPSLMATLKADTGAGDRLGSAQALSEVLAGLGTGRLEETLPTILQNVSSSKASVREGFMSLFIFLPACFGNSFASYLAKIIPPILAGLADDVDAIRETALKAGRLLVKNFATKSIDLLLPELERGLADDSYRIRLSSVELVGDLLFNLSGVNVADLEEDEGETISKAGQNLLEVLGEEKRNKVLSSLYICRCDTSSQVRTAAVNVWKVMVASPRTLKDLVPTLTQFIIRRLGSSNMEQKVIAGNALGELIRKAGEGVLSTLLPSLEDGLVKTTDVDAKQGICLALRELIVSTSDDSLEMYEEAIVSIVRTALVDSHEDVREAAAEAFDALQRQLGKRVVDQVLPELLHLLQDDTAAEQALSALLTLLTEATRANIILPILIPTLLSPPISAFNARALAALAEVASSAISRKLPHIINALVDDIIATKDDELRQGLSDALDRVLEHLDEDDGLNTALVVMRTLLGHEDHVKRAKAATHMGRFFLNTDVDLSQYYPDLIRILLICFDDSDKEVVKASWDALKNLTGCMRKEEMETMVVPTRTALRQVGVPGANLPGFCLPKGISAILPIFLQGLLNGTSDQRVQSALAIGDIIDRTSAEALRPFVTQLTGPLIRVVSERSVDLKCAVFLSLNKLLEKIPLFVKPFLPQLQRTFARGLADTSSEKLRTRAAKGLGILITLTPRVDPLIAELITGCKNPDDGVKNAMLRALHEVVSKVGNNMSDASKQGVLDLIDEQSSNDRDDAINITMARLLGVLVDNLSDAATTQLIKTRILTTQFTHPSVLGLNAILAESPELLTGHFASETPVIICQGMKHKDVFIADNSILAAGKYLLGEDIERNPEIDQTIVETLASIVAPGNPSDTRRIALVVLRTVSRLESELVRPHLASLVPPVFASVRDPVIPVKLAAEATFLNLFGVVESEAALFEEYMAGPGAELAPGPKRSIQDYFKRIAMKLAGQARERKEAEGGEGGLGLSSDEVDDEKEVWSVGKLDVDTVEE